MRDSAVVIDRGRRAALAQAAALGLMLGGTLRTPTSHAATSSNAGGAFDATSLTDVLRALGSTPVESDAIDLELPELTENGAMVPVSVTSRLAGTAEILLVAEANPWPLVARFDVAPGTEPYISTRVKLAQSCTVWAIVRADGHLYAKTRGTAVIEGGCGG